MKGQQSDFKKAIVTLEEGQTIDITTRLKGLRKGAFAMALRTYNPITPGLRQLVLVDRSQLWKGKPVKALTEGRAERRPKHARSHHCAAPRRRT